MTISTNRTRLVTQILTGEVWPALGDRHAYRVDADGAPFVLPGMGGVTLGVHPGDAATGYAADHLEPGLSIRHRDEGANYALQYLSCVGNTVTVRTGPSAGARGRVTGQHAYVLADFAEDDLAGVCVGDQVTVRAYGQGLRLTDHEAVTVKNLDPGLLDGLALETAADGRLRVPVAALVPPEAVGAGAGMYSEYANTDLMGAYAGQGGDLSLGLEGLRIGDLVALADQDHRFGRGYRPGYTTIGVISTGHCRLFGHGPGPSSLLSGPTSAFDLRVDGAANLGAMR
jgi:hypothetical protein